MNSPFTSMAHVLSATAAVLRPPFPNLAPQRTGESRTGNIRALLRERGPMSALQIALELDLPAPALVGALLKSDLHAGRAFHRNGEYHWNHGYDEQLADEISAAVRLLKKNGYSVERTSV